MIKYFSFLSIFLCFLFLSHCAVYRSVEERQAYPFTESIIIDNPVDGAVVPNNLGEIELSWKDSSDNSSWVVFIHKGDDSKQQLTTKEKRVMIRLGEYGKKSAKNDRNISCLVCGTDAQGIISRCGKQVSLKISEYGLNESIRYRLVEPLFNAAQDSAIMQKNIGGKDSQPVFETKAVCVGCHAYSSNGLAAFNIRKGKDRRLVILKPAPDGLQLFDTRKIGEFAFIAWSPDARNLAIVVNTFGTIDVKPDVVEPFNLMYVSGDIGIYDAATKQIKLLPGASEMDFTEDMPAWSPDGKHLLFVKYHTDKEQGIKNMGIYRVPFNNGEGGAPEPVMVPSHDGEYYYFPNYSPDGKWISFVKGDGSRGVFARKTSDIYIMSSSGGEAEKLSFNIDGVMDSWHRWSSDSRWLLFSSKRGGDMTALYLSRIDENGGATPPVRIAQHKSLKVNLPENVDLQLSQAGKNNCFSEIIDSIFVNAN